MTQRVKRESYPWQSPRAWHGMTATVWFRLLARNRFAVSPSRWPMALAITAVSCLNSALRFLSESRYRRAAESTRIAHPPLFVLGHWRTGTTLLHELLILDPRHGYPSTYECMVPHHFLLTGRLFPRLLGVLLPKNRPMDNMPVGWDRPQEDEFALVNLGVPSPYLQWAFPNRPCPHGEYLTLRHLSDEELLQWRESLRWFLRRLTLKNPRRIVLKSPTHTARVRVLLKEFPEAKFVHIVRDPLVVIPSTQRMWNSIADFFGLQLRREDYALERAIENFLRLNDAFEEDRDLLAPQQLHEMRYEDLIADPIGTLEETYERLQLGDFAIARPLVEAYLQKSKDYRTNRYELGETARALITCRCKSYMQDHGYAAARAAVPAG